MRDKLAVEEWKAGIKAQLMRQGLIRGQPRSSLMHTTSPVPVVQSHSRVQPYRHVSSVTGPGPSSLSRVELDADLGYHYVDSTRDLDGHGRGIHTMLPTISNRSSSYHRLSISSYSDVDINSHDMSSPSFTFPSATSTAPPSTAITGTNEPFQFDFSIVNQVQGHADSAPLFDYEPPHPPPTVPSFSVLSGVNRGEFVVYYFNQVRKLQYIFAGNSVTNATYSLVLQEPEGAVTNAVCALASLHYKRRQVADGLETLGGSPDQSKLFYDEASFQIAAGKQVRGRYTESDAVAALHLISYSLLSGGAVDWRTALGVGYDWLAQTGINVDENPRLTMLNLSLTGRCAIRTIMWFDIVSSISVMRAPKYLALYRRLFGRTSVYWNTQLSDENLDLSTDFQSGCPDDVMIAIGEVSALAEWKASEIRNGCLSVRELIRRGDDIEQQLRQHHPDSGTSGEVDQVPLHPNLPQLANAGHTTQFPNDDIRRLTSNIFREAVTLYLHTVLSGANPAVPEISASVGTTMQLLNQLPSSEVDRSLVFPICIAGCMTDDPVNRNLLSGRLQGQDQNIGNLLQTRAVMEAVWRKRDSHGTTVDWRDNLREQGKNLLLV